MLRYLLCAAGDISLSDVDLAAASGGMVLGFNLEPDEAVLSHAKRLGEGARGGGASFGKGDEIGGRRGKARFGAVSTSTVIEVLIISPSISAFSFPCVGPPFNA